MAKQNFGLGGNPYSFYNRRGYGSTDTMGDVLGGLLTTIGEQEKQREDRRQKWRDDQAAFAKSRDELKASPNQNANAFMANWSQGLQDNARGLQYQLENGQIKSSDYTKAWANLTNSNTQLISSQTNYQQQVQKLYDDFNAGTGSGANMDSINEFNRLTDWANLKTEINEDGSMNVFNAKTGEVVTPYFLSNLTGSNVLKYQAQTEAKKIVDQFGAKSVKDGLGVTIEGTYFIISEFEEAQSELEEALKAVSRGMLNNSSTASVLIDQLGYKTVWDKKDVKKGKTILRKADGTFEVEDEQHAADAFMVKTLKAALPYKKEETQELTPVQEVRADLDQQRIDEAERAHRERERLQALRDKKSNVKAGSTIYSDPYEAFEAYIVADEELEKNASGIVIGGVNADLLSDKENNTSNQEDASNQVIAPLVAKFGDLGFSFTLDNTSDFFTVVGPSGGEGIRIDYDEQPSDALEEYQRLMSFIRAEYKTPDLLESKYKVIGYDPFKGSITVDASGRPIGGGVGGKYNSK